ncbi:hypothetical protein B0T16DRAFT_439431 [Cercophora newfieldiana]|uniref:HD domain-containing protein n=1 Tax=Cercophora newfieldiana TaxID=92897 RepID=A0AA39XXI5_9PEZI|nr:hypothetical protein B0T16DRAFT_439431 [Cercophora newfieldiana]
MLVIPTLIFYLVLHLTSVSLPIFTAAAPHPSASLPHRTLAGISIIDTPIVRAAQAYAQLHCSPGTYNHVMRTWLSGVYHLSHNSTLASQVDLEVHALGLILHDLATHHDLNAEFVSRYRRFEVDSAVAAANFLRSYLQSHPEEKEADVFAIYWGNELEFSWGRPGGEKMGVTDEEYARVVKEFSREVGGGEGGGILEFVAWYCRFKPESTYRDTWMQPFGEMLVPGYSAVGHRLLDLNLAAAGVNVSKYLDRL